MESYLENIVSIYDKTTNDVIEKHRYDIQKNISKYSNTKVPIYKIIIDNIPISRNNSYIVQYNCHTCGMGQHITLNLYVRKINKNTIHCESCKNTNEQKRKTHSKFMEINSSKIRKGTYSHNSTTPVNKNPLDERIRISICDWDKEDDEFKEKYYMHHLSQDDYVRILPKIVSINHDKITDLENWSYFPTYRIYNQTKFTPMLINKHNQCAEKPLYVKFKCDNCDLEFIHRDIEVVKNSIKLLCQTCSLTNRTFRLRTTTLKNGEKIMWQSIPERRFIEWCDSHNISIKNGPSIEYVFRDKSHKYRVDFELPDKKMLIEIKDNHCWHKAELESGKFQSKETAAKQWCLENEYTYHLIFPKTLQAFKDSINV